MGELWKEVICVLYIVIFLLSYKNIKSRSHKALNETVSTAGDWIIKGEQPMTVLAYLFLLSFTAS